MLQEVHMPFMGITVDVQGFHSCQHLWTAVGAGGLRVHTLTVVKLLWPGLSGYGSVSR